MAVGEIAPQTVFLDDTVAVDISTAFRDPDGDPLTVSAASSDASVVAASASGSQVVLIGVSRGSAVVTITARDPDGAEARQSIGVEVPNRGPMPVGAIEAQTLYLGETVTVDVSAAFSDPDGDGLTFEAASSDTAVARTTVSGTEVTVEAVERGGASVTVTARDPDGGEASQEFEVTVPNRAPAVAGELRAQSLLPGETVTVDVAAAFSDPDGDPLAFEATSSDLGVVGVSLADSVGEVMLEGVARGTATVSVTARDPDGAEAGQSFEVTVRNRNPVVVSDLPPRTLLPGQTVTVDVAEVFRDPDGDPLTFEASSSDTEVAAASAVGSEVTVRGVSKGTATVSVTARDPDGAEAGQSFEVVVPNRAPAVAGELRAQSLLPGETVTVGVSSAFSDPDGDSLAFEATSSDPGVVGVSVADSAAEVTLEGVARGTATVSVTARDPDGAEAGQRFEVTVRNRNPVVVSDLPPRTLLPGQTVTVDVAGVFRDPDGDPLTFEASSSDTEVAAVSAIASEVTVRGVSKGTATVSVTARDPDGAEAGQSFEVVVPNRAPAVAGELRAQSLLPGETVTVGVSSAFSDPDGDSLAFEATSSDPGVVGVSVADSAAEVTLEGVARGTATVSVTARDPDGAEAGQRFEVTVRNRNPVVVSDLPPRTLLPGQTVTVDVAGVFRDPDGDPLTFEASSSDTEVAAVSAIASEVTVRGVSKGTATVTVTARDDHGGDVRQSFSVKVPNRRPVISGAIPAQTVEEGATTTVDVASYFSDPDGDALDFGASSSNAAVADVSTSGSGVTIEGVTAGSASVTVAARDPDGGEARQSFGVTVGPPPPPNQRPVVSSAIPAQTVRENASVSVDLDGHFRDPEGGALNYGATSSDEGVATADISGSDVVVGGVNEGTARVTVTATDPGGLSADHEFGVMVRPPPPPNQRPVVSSAIPAQTVRENASVSVDLDGHFRDPEGGALNYGATSSNEGVATADISDSDLTVQGVSEGTATVTVTATDLGGLQAQQQFGVTVEAQGSTNRAPEVTGTIADRTAIRGGELSVQAYRYFSDPDDDELSYTVGTSNAAVATVRRVNPAVFYVTAVSDGQAVITVTAQDRGGLTASTSFTFAVGNNAPRVTAEAPAVTSSPDQIDTLTFWSHFEETDVGDELDFSASSTNSGVASVSVKFSTLYGFYAEVRGVTAGEATINMTATDRGGLTASTSSLVTVTANRPPRITQGIGGQTLAVGDTLTWNLSDHFSDPDNDPLTYTAAGGIRVSASVTGSTFTVVGASAGISPVSVTATDPSGRTAEIAFLAFVTASQSIEGLASSNPRRRVRWTDAVAKDRAVLVGVSPSGHRRAEHVFLFVPSHRLVSLGLHEGH
ncbi:Ig-like domain-containing protein [Candidatus Palauibacter sp.]|uniref:Ig-like domain-containing protein n=1 Tax=Candidatus Palauibacter sp. TaxID=3101350 RepID=UPI003B51AAF6